MNRAEGRPTSGRVFNGVIVLAEKVAQVQASASKRNKVCWQSVD